MRSQMLVVCGFIALAGARLGAQVSPSIPPTAGAISPAPGDIGRGPATGRRAGRAGRHGGMGRALLRGVSLTDAQRSQLTGIEHRYRDERRTLRGSGTGAVGRDTSSRAAARGLRQRELADMRGVLTASQQSTFDRNVQEWRATARQRRANRTPGVTGR